MVRARSPQPSPPRSTLPPLRALFPELAHSFWPTPFDPCDAGHLLPPSHVHHFPPRRDLRAVFARPLAPSDRRPTSPHPPSTHQKRARSPSPSLLSDTERAAPHAAPQHAAPPYSPLPSTSPAPPPPACTFDVLRTDPRTGTLAHIGSSQSRSTHIPRFPLPTPTKKPFAARTVPAGGLTPAAVRRLQKEAAGAHVCTLCRRAFDRASALAIHSRTHTGARPFVCPAANCQRRFSVESNMRRHARRHLEFPLTRAYFH